MAVWLRGEPTVGQNLFMAIVTKAGNVSNGTAPIYVEVDQVEPGNADLVYGSVQTRNRVTDKVVELARDVYEEGLDLARRCAEQAAVRLGDLGDAVKPDEIELQLAIKLDADLGAVLVKTGAEAQLQVTFRWKPGGEE